MMDVATRITIHLTEDDKSDLIGASDLGEQQWRRVAVRTGSILARNPGKRMEVYSAVASYARRGSSAVRNWRRIYVDVGDALLDEFEDTFGFSHWREMSAYARKRPEYTSAERSDRPDVLARLLDREARKWSATADDYGGMPIPVDALKAKLRGVTKTNRTQIEGRIDEVFRRKSDGEKVIVFVVDPESDTPTVNTDAVMWWED